MRHEIIGGLIILAAFVAFLLLMGSPATAGLPRMDSLTATYTADGDCIKAYVIIDPDTGQQYLVSDHGGITPRLK